MVFRVDLRNFLIHRIGYLNVLKSQQRKEQNIKKQHLNVWKPELRIQQTEKLTSQDGLNL